MIIEIEYAILDFIEKYLSSPLMDKIMVFFTKLGDFGIIWIVICALLLIHPKTRYIGFVGLFSLLFSLLINNIMLKNIFQRTRPFVEINKELIIPIPLESSFPSGHTSSSFACAFVFGKYFKKPYYYFTYILAVIIAFSRLYLYVHFPTDILAGVVMGYFCGFLAIVLFNKYKVYQEKKFTNESSE